LLLNKNPNDARRNKLGRVQSAGPVSGVVFVFAGEYTGFAFCDGIFSIKGAGVGQTVGVMQSCCVVVPPLLSVKQLPSANICCGHKQKITIVHSMTKNIFIELVATLHD